MEDGNDIRANIALSRSNTSLSTSDFVADFSFNNLQNGQSYRLSPQRPKDWLNGVTTFDIALISRHLLDIENFNSPYKRIAADADHDGDISAADMLYIRKIILRQLDSIPGNRSWRFVPKEFVFPNPTDPFATDFPESMTYPSLTTSVSNSDFVAIKTGDVNVSARDNQALPLAQKTQTGLNFTIKDVAFQKGDIKDIVISTETDIAQAFQFTLNYDNRFLSFKAENTEGGAIKGLDASNYAHFKTAGKLTFSWNGETHAWKTFIIKMEALADVHLKDVLKMTSDLTPAEAYDDLGNPMPVRLKFENQNTRYTAWTPHTADSEPTDTEGYGAVLFQNVPNPLHDETLIQFNLPVAGKGQLTIFDEMGRVLHCFKGDYLKGVNDIFITPNMPLPTGILMYRLDIFGNMGKTVPFSATKQMVVLKR